MLLAIFCAVETAPPGFAQASREYDLKAALMFNFTQFVEWPASTFRSPDAPFIIGILGRDPFGNVIDDLVRTESCGMHRIQVVRYRRVEDIDSCQMLFIPESERNRLPRILAAVKGRPILTVSDIEGFALRGGMMRLWKQPDGRIHLRINLNEVKAAGLMVSSKLLRVAEVVSTESR